MNHVETIITTHSPVTRHTTGGVDKAPPPPVPPKPSRMQKPVIPPKPKQPQPQQQEQEHDELLGNYLFFLL